MPPPIDEEMLAELKRIGDALEALLSAVSGAVATAEASDIPEQIALALNRIGKLSERVREGEVRP